MKKVILVTGGQRSGKSAYAERLALSLSEHPVYMATSRIWDEEFRRRVEAHKERRGPMWTNIEEEKELSRHDVTGRVVVIDCVTLWATNFFFDLQSSAHRCAEGAESQVDETLRLLKDEFERFTNQDAVFVFVTNEIGSGGVSDNDVQRRFTDVEGWFNQYVAAHADEVILMVSGIAVKIKGHEKF
jgi:adenosylcobinamide kinase/adenosylcobinamide-phosphate guanylyltransferase